MIKRKTKIMAVGLSGLIGMSSMGGTALAHGAKLPLGDGQVSSHPQQNYVYSCQQRFNPNAPGARAAGDWIKGDFWYPDLKPTVDGPVKWSNAALTVSINGNTRTVTSNNLPSHLTGTFPVKRSDDAYKYDRNPNSIQTQRINLSLPANPEVAGQAHCVPMGMIGVALTGAAIYNALDARGDDAPAHEIQDECGGHPERQGQYHYHNGSDCMVERDPTKSGHSGLVGYALDGFGIYGAYEASGKKLDNEDLDECHGHVGSVMWDSELKETYHYHLTDEYPYTLGCFKGTPVRTR